MPQRVFYVSTYFLCFLNILQYASDLQVDGADDLLGWKAGDFPDPLLDPKACGLSKDIYGKHTAVAIQRNNITEEYIYPWICDPDSVLLQHELHTLADLVTECQREAPCECNTNCTGSTGYIIAVAIVDQLNTDGEFQPMIIKAKVFADEIRQKWFLDRGCDDNVLLFYTWHTNKLYISLGSKAEEVISDIELARLYRTGKSLFVRKPSTEFEDEDGIKPEEESNITTTYLGMDALVRQTHAGIMNGSSMTSSMLFSITIPILLLMTVILMCLISNCCCAQDFLYDPTADKSTIDRLIR